MNTRKQKIFETVQKLFEMDETPPTIIKARKNPAPVGHRSSDADRAMKKALSGEKETDIES